MRKFLPRLQTITIFLTVVVLLLTPSFAHAQGFGCITSVAGFIDCTYGALGQFLWEIVIPIIQSVLGVIGLLIDTAITLSLTSSFYAGPAISSGWAIIRDLCNIIFIFVLIFTGIRTMLGLDTGETRRVVVSVIIGAVLINFSLFLTKAAIDVSNIFTAWITQGIIDLSGGTGGVSNSTVSVLKMHELYQTQTTGNLQIGAFSTAFAVIALNIVAIYVFFKVAFLMFGRLVSFITLLIMSPIGFVGHLVPKLGSYAEKWRDELTKACFMAPMFLLMLYITLYLATKFDAVLSEMGQKLSLNSTNTFFSGNSFGLDDYTLFIIIALLLLKSLEVAEEYTGAVAGQIGGVLKSAAGIALGGATAGVGLVGRQVIGRTALNMTQNKERMALLQSQAAQSGIAGVWARTKLGALNKGATSSFDARATKLGGAALGSMDPNLSVAGIKLDASKVGKTQSGGFKAQVEEIAKTEKEYAEKNLGKGKAGEANRLKYANTVSNSLWYVGRRAGAKKAGEDISEAAYKAYTKSEKEGAEKDAQKIKNLIIDNQIATDTLKGALTQSDSAVINKSVDTASAKIDDFMKKRKKDASGERVKLTWKANQMDKDIDDRIASGDYDGANELRGSDEYALAISARRDADEDEKASAEKMGNLTSQDYNDAVKSYKKKVVDTEHEVIAAKKILSEARSLEKIVEKKEKINEAIEHINAEIIGEEGSWDGKNKRYKTKRDKDGNDVIDKDGNPVLDEGSGLKKELNENKRKAQDRKDESRAIGAEGGGNAPTPKDEDEEDDK